MQSETQYLELAQAQRALLEAGSAKVMNAQREAAGKLLAETGFPTTKSERYKYTDACAAFAPDFGINLRRVAPENPYSTFKCAVPRLTTSLYYIINDVVCPAAPDAQPLPEGVMVSSFREIEATQPERLARYNALAANDKDGVTAVNTLLAQDGLLVSIPESTALQHPIQIVCFSSAKQPLMSNRRLLIEMGKDSKADILICEHADGAHNYLSTLVVEGLVADGAHLDICTIEETAANNTRFANFYIEQGAASRVTLNGITLRGGLSRQYAHIRLSGEGASADTAGAVILSGRQHADHHLLIEHAAPHCESDMLYKYVADDHSTGAFAGKVLVRPGAQKTNAQQSNANLCIAPTARIYSQPMLEIYADDVKCNHGSTTGKLDEQALFYMRQRGIEEPEARLLLQHAFVNEVLQRIEAEPLRERLAHLVDLRFRGELVHLQVCRIRTACETKGKKPHPTSP